MKPTTTFDLVLVPFPFSDLSAVKKRPCLVLKRFEAKKVGAYVVVCMVTSQLDGLSFLGDLAISNWKEAGLPKPSLIRVGKLVTLEESIVLRRLGRLSASDQAQLRKKWREFFKEV